VGLKPAIPQHAAGIRIEPPLWRPVARERVDDVPEMRVLRGDAVGELVQVRLADERVTRLLEAANGLGGPRRDVLAKDRRAVRRRQSGGVEEILDREPRPLGDDLRPREERVEFVAQLELKLSRRRVASRRGRP
jgi:hypothetical protein